MKSQIDFFKTKNGFSTAIAANEPCKRSILFHGERFFIYVPTTIFKIVLEPVSSIDHKMNYFGLAFSLDRPENLLKNFLAIRRRPTIESELFQPYLPNIWSQRLQICLGYYNTNYVQKLFNGNIGHMEVVIKYAIDCFWNSEFTSAADGGTLAKYSFGYEDEFMYQLDRKTKTGWTPSEKDLKPWGSFSDFVR